jgi:hypothetical protein
MTVWWLRSVGPDGLAGVAVNHACAETLPRCTHAGACGELSCSEHAFAYDNASSWFPSALGSLAVPREGEVAKESGSAEREDLASDRHEAVAGCCD